MHIQRGRLSLPSPHAKHGALLLLPYAQWQLCCVNIFSALTDMCKSSSPHAPASVPCPLCTYVLAPNPPPLSLSLPRWGTKQRKCQRQVLAAQLFQHMEGTRGEERGGWRRIIMTGQRQAVPFFILLLR